MPESDNDLISANEAGKILKVTGARVREYVRDGRLKAQMIGSSYVLRRGEVKAFRPMPVGRPVQKEDKPKRRRGKSPK